MSDEELNQLINDIGLEQDRRRALAVIPDQMERLRQTYIDSGGDPADLPHTA